MDAAQERARRMLPVRHIREECARGTRLARRHRGRLRQRQMAQQSASASASPLAITVIRPPAAAAAATTTTSTGRVHRAAEQPARLRQSAHRVGAQAARVERPLRPAHRHVGRPGRAPLQRLLRSHRLGCRSRRLHLQQQQQQQSDIIDNKHQPTQPSAAAATTTTTTTAAADKSASSVATLDGSVSVCIGNRRLAARCRGEEGEQWQWQWQWRDGVDSFGARRCGRQRQRRSARVARSERAAAQVGQKARQHHRRDHSDREVVRAGPGRVLGHLSQGLCERWPVSRLAASRVLARQGERRVQQPGGHTPLPLGHLSRRVGELRADAGRHRPLFCHLRRPVSDLRRVLQEQGGEHAPPRRRRPRRQLLRARAARRRLQVLARLLSHQAHSAHHQVSAPAQGPALLHRQQRQRQQYEWWWRRRKRVAQ